MRSQTLIRFVSHNRNGRREGIPPQQFLNQRRKERTNTCAWIQDANRATNGSKQGGHETGDRRGCQKLPHFRTVFPGRASRYEPSRQIHASGDIGFCAHTRSSIATGLRETANTLSPGRNFDRGTGFNENRRINTPCSPSTIPPLPVRPVLRWGRRGVWRAVACRGFS